MQTGLMHIELHAIVLGNDVTIAQYLSPVVPQQRETIHLRIHPGYQTMPSEELAREHTGTFLVNNITYEVFNLEQTEPWFEPWAAHKVSDYVIIEVIATNDNAREYVQRLANIEQ